MSALSFEAARKVVIDTVHSFTRTTETERVKLDQAYGRTLAEDLLADRDYPALRRSLRDGFAVRSEDVPGELRVRGEARAGDESADAPLAKGESVEIMTGAPVPQSADAVVMVEHVVRVNGGIKIDRPAEPGQFINNQGAEARSGSTLISSGTVLDGSHIAALAMAGQTQIAVGKRPRVAILATGDEIVAVDGTPAAHQIRNSNAHMLASLVHAAGGAATILPVARDTVESLRPLLAQGFAHDMLIVSGGVSAGRYDLVKPTLRDLGVAFSFERVRVQPGQPTTFGTVDSKPVFGLPGNPGSSLITFQLFARAALEILCGVKEPILPLLSAAFEAPFKHKPGLTRFLPARLSQDGQHLRHIPWQGSSDIPALARANVFLIADENRAEWQVGDSIPVMRKP